MPPNNPNFGTGFVDWSSFVNANQNNINQDRGAVQGYLGNQANQLQGMGAGDQFNALQGSLGTDVNALASPGGFEQVLAHARGKYDPTDPKQTPPSAPDDQFAAALEGQNAKSLYGGQDPYSIQPKAPPGPAAPKDPGGLSGGPPSGNPEGPPNDVGQQHRQDAAPDWGSYVNPQDYPGHQMYNQNQLLNQKKRQAIGRVAPDTQPTYPSNKTRL